MPSPAHAMPAGALMAAAPTRLPLAADCPLFDVASIRRIEAAALAQRPPGELMQRAGLAAARLALAIAPHARSVWVVCGPGNNGGDGLECALQLHRLGHRVAVSLLPGTNAPQGDAALALQRAQDAGVPIAIGPLAPARPFGEDSADDLAIDALLGIGARREPSEPIAAAVAALNHGAAPVLALDLPTGLDADTGRLLGQTAVRARHTITYLAAKPGLFTAHGRDHAGQVWIDDLGVPAAAEPTVVWLGGTQTESVVRRHADHKGVFGDVVAVGGAPGMGGAAELAARAAHAAGAGRVYLHLLGSTATAPPRPELMTLPHPWTDLQHETPWWAARTAVVGCGGGDAVADTLPALLRAAARLVVDADALNAIANDAALRRQLAHRRRAGLATILTPHPLEAARLLDTHTAEVQNDRLHAARELAARLGVIVVLKGSGTVIADPEAGIWINASGSPALATPGSGDVLAGWIGGLWSAAAASQDGCSPVAVAMRAARESVALHGRVAEGIVQGPLRAADLIEAMWRSRAVLMPLG